jgi:hypothetical protein
MRRREILVFFAAFAVVLLGGAALAQVGTFASSPGDTTATLRSPAAAAVTTIADPGATDEAPAEVAAGATAVSATNQDAAETSSPPADEAEKPPAAEAEEPPPAEPKEEDPDPPRDATPPPLEILFPENEQHFEEDHIAFEGKTEPGAEVFAGPYEADVDDAGNWRIVLILSPGGNTVKFTATDAAGNVATATVKVYLDVAKETTTEFTAYQKWEKVDGSPAANIYYGTARPGTEVWVGSAYGEGVTVADDAGKWELKVKFPAAPCNERFTVVVEAGEHRREFQMKYVCASREFSANQKYAENTEPWTKFYGTGLPGTTVWVVSDFGSTTTTVADNGEWFAKLHFGDDLPANKAVAVVVEGENGRAEFSFYWVVAQSEEIEFTAHQKYGSCAEEVPYDVFFGTATPGATIWVESPHGHGVTTAGDKGAWDIKVEFPEAPRGEPFTVVVESSDGGRATFTFVHTE